MVYNNLINFGKYALGVHPYYYSGTCSTAVYEKDTGVKKNFYVFYLIYIILLVIYIIFKNILLLYIVYMYRSRISIHVM